MSSPILWGPNNLSNNLQSGTLLNSGTLINYNGQKNYISNGNFENGSATGWSAVGTAVLTNGLLTSVGTGGAAFSATNGGRAPSGTSAPSVVSTGQLSGNYSLSFTTFSNPGEMYISQPYNIDSADQAKVLNISFNYSSISGTVNFSGTSANSYACAVYDLVNNQWLPVVGAFNLVQGTGVGLFTGTVQTNSSTVGIQLSVYTPNAPPTPSSLLLDSFVVGPQFIATGPAMSDWVSSAGVPMTGFGTITSLVYKSRRVGDSLEVLGSFTAGTPTAVLAQIGTYYNGGAYTVDTSKCGASQLIGIAGNNSSSATFFQEGILAPPSNQSYVTMGVQQSTTNILVATNANNLVATGGIIEFSFTVPIVGWSSNTVQSSDSLQQVVVYTAQGVPTSIISTSFTLLQIPTVTDNTGSVNTSIFTAPVTGYYAYSCNVGISISGASSAGAQNQLGAYKNGSTSIASDVISIITSAAGYTYTNNLTGIIQLNTGDTLQFKFLSQQTTNISFTTGNISISRLSGPAVVQATESVNAAYTSTAGTAITTAAVAFVFGTKDYDSHSAYNNSTGAYTCPVSGKYSVKVKIFTASVTLTTAQNIQLILYKNGAAYKYIDQINGNGAAALYTPGGCVSASCLAGDTLSIIAIASISTATNTTAGSVHFEIERVGN